MIKVAVFASGTGSNFETIAISQKKIENCSYNIKLLIVDKENAGAIEKAKALGIPTYFVNPKEYSSKELFEGKILKILKENEIEFIALAGYMRIFGTVLLENYGGKIINIHPSFLPAYPGKDSILRAFNEKSKSTGVTIHYVDSGIDTGKIIFQEKIDINPAWTLSDLEKEIHKTEHKIYPTILDKICKTF